MTRQVRHSRRSKYGKRFPAGRGMKKRVIRIVSRRRNRIGDLDKRYQTIERKLKHAENKKEVENLLRQAYEINKESDKEIFGNLNLDETFRQARQDYLGPREAEIELRLLEIRKLKEEMKDKDAIEQSLIRQKIGEIQEEITAL